MGQTFSSGREIKSILNESLFKPKILRTRMKRNSKNMQLKFNQKKKSALWLEQGSVLISLLGITTDRRTNQQTDGHEGS